MDDLISRQALCEYALNQKDKSITPNDIMRFPSAQPEIIHCRECAYADNYYQCPFVKWWAGPEDYCSRAERKQNGRHDQ